MKLNPLLLFLSAWLVSLRLEATEMTHVWVIDLGSDGRRIGLIGIHDAFFGHSTGICLGGKWEWDFEVPLHIYVVCGALALPVLVSLLLFSAKCRRDKQSAQP
jgi:hypothetical protein